MYHAIHAFGLAELLKAGTSIVNVDDEHFWNLIDNTYIDDVSLRALRDDSQLTHQGERGTTCRAQVSI